MVVTCTTNELVSSMASASGSVVYEEPATTCSVYEQQARLRRLLEAGCTSFEGDTAATGGEATSWQIDGQQIVAHYVPGLKAFHCAVPRANHWIRAVSLSR